MDFSTAFKTRWFPVVAGLSLAVIFVLVEISAVGPLKALQQRLDALFYDLRLTATLPDSPPLDERIVIVDIDEESVRTEGRWPWSRKKLALLTDRLHDAGAVVIGFDIIFSEPEQNPVDLVLGELAGMESAANDDLRDLVPAFDSDGRFANSLQNGDAVLGYLFHHSAGSPAGYLPPPLAIVTPEQAAALTVPAMSSFTGNLPLLGKSAGHAGFTTTLFDRDGILRRSPLMLRYEDGLYPALALEVARLFLLIDDVKIRTERIGNALAVERIDLGTIAVPTDGAGQVVIPYRGPAGQFRYLSATDVLNGNIDPGTVSGNIVLVGATALGVADLVSTPVQSSYPGVEVHATLLGAILDGRFPVEPSWARGANLTLIGASGLVLAPLLPFLGPLGLLFFSAAVIAGLLAFNLWLWTAQDLALNTALPLMLVFALVVLNLAYGFLVEHYRRTRLKGMFGQYVPPELVEQMSAKPSDYTFEGESRDMSVLFADVQDFTAISEQLTPVELKELLNLFFTDMTGVIFDYRGTIDKYVGDMIMAFWGAPLADERHAEHAIDAALGMLAKLAELNPRLTSIGLPTIRIGIGVNTGIMNVGDMGSAFRRAYTVVGDNVNLASRIEGLTRYYGVDLIVGENTRAGQDRFLFRPLDRVRVKGKTNAVQVYQPMCRIDEAHDEIHRTLTVHERALHCYLNREWDDATALFRQLSEQEPGARLYRVYLERIAQLREQNPGADWDGVFDRRMK